MNFPYGINPTEAQIESAISKLAKVYFSIPETTCSHRNECCSAGCPNMYFCEFLAIRRKFVDRMPKAKRQELTMACIRYYVMGQKAKRPCVFLKDDKMCSVYDWRHVKCRLYGLIPQPLYEWIVDSVARESGTKREQMPLCSQCDQVKIRPECIVGKEKDFPNGKIPEMTIKKMEQEIRDIDLALGMPPAMQAKGYGFLTYHDWHLLYELGPKWMEKLSVVRQKFSDQEKEKFVSDLNAALVAASKS